jgi:hypothetical protein
MQYVAIGCISRTNTAICLKTSAFQGKLNLPPKLHLLKETYDFLSWFLHLPRLPFLQLCYLSTKYCSFSGDFSFCTFRGMLPSHGSVLPGEREKEKINRTCVYKYTTIYICIYIYTQASLQSLSHQYSNTCTFINLHVYVDIVGITSMMGKACLSYVQ